MKQLPTVLFAVLLAYIYASLWLARPGDVIESERPYVYRQLVPLVARLISTLTGWPFVASVVLITCLCAAGFALSAYYLYRSFYEG